MPDVVKHAWTHRPRAQGGTDPIEMPTALPIVYCAGSGHTLPEGDSYSLSALDGVSVGAADGIMDTITFANDPADGSEVFWAGPDEDRIRVFNGIYAFQVEAGIVINTDPTAFTGYAALYVSAPSTLFFQSPVTNVIDSRLNDPSAFTISTDTITLRLAATVLVNTGSFNQDPIPTQRLEVVFIQETGGDLTTSQSWCIFTRLTDLNNQITYTAA